MLLRGLVGVGLAVTAAPVALAQQPDSSLAFEVATVKPATLPGAPDGKHMIRVGSQGGPGTSDPGQISYSFLSLRNLLAQAFDLKTYQVSGPDWLDSERFDIVAKAPKGATKGDVRIMLRNLLKERFQLAFHRDKKELPGYALVAGKSSPKMKESEDQSDPNAAPASGASPDAAPPPPPPGEPGRLKVGKDGMPELPPGVQRPGIMMMAAMSPNGIRMKLSGHSATSAQLAESLSNQVDRPVVDMTGLTARYDFTLDFAPDPSAMMAKMGPMPAGMMPPPGAGGGGDTVPRASLPETDAATVFAAVQSQLGLKLEAKKAPVEMLVIDHLEKTPAEN
jgi:uncharacterized protein (TIGR03435 family)